METDWQEVLDEALAGSTEAFGTLFQGYLKPQMEKYVWGLMKNKKKNVEEKKKDVEDIVQEIFMYLFEKSRYLNILQKSLEVFSHLQRSNDPLFPYPKHPDTFL